ncbi:MAG: DUF1835 domain-containing protein [Pseudomonadota bacterium]
MQAEHARSLHVVSGETAAGALRAVLGAEIPLLVQRDFLFAGPVPPFTDIEHFKSVRAAYLSSLWPGLGEDIHQQPQDLLCRPARLAEHDHLTVWAGCGLEDTLLVLLVLHLAQLLRLPPGQVRLIRYPAPEAGQGAWAIGQMAPAALARHPPAVPLDDASAAAFRAGWQALTAPTPERLNAYAQPGSGATAAASVRCMLSRYPQLASGLSDWELALLRPLLRGPSTVATRVAGALSRGTGEDAIRELLLLDMLRGLGAGRAPLPLVEFAGGEGPVQARELRLTPFGRAVLRGRETALSANPLTRWIGGVHLDSRAGRLWLRDGQQLVPAPRRQPG